MLPIGPQTIIPSCSPCRERNYCWFRLCERGLTVYPNSLSANQTAVRTAQLQVHGSGPVRNQPQRSAEVPNRPQIGARRSCRDLSCSRAINPQMASGTCSLVLRWSPARPEVFLSRIPPTDSLVHAGALASPASAYDPSTHTEIVREYPTCGIPSIRNPEDAPLSVGNGSQTGRNPVGK